MENTSGIQPIEYKVLIEPMAVEEKIGSIIIPDQRKDREQYAQTRGHIVAVSPLAFTYVSDEEWRAAGATKPQVGDQVIYGKYKGVNVRGPADDKEYTIVNDKDICAVVK